MVNPRYCVRNANKWIDHRPAQIVPAGTIFQPQTPSKCSVAKLTDPKPFMTRSTRYCLYAQEQDTDGELETKLYKVSLAEFRRYSSRYKISVPWEEKGPRSSFVQLFSLELIFEYRLFFPPTYRYNCTSELSGGCIADKRRRSAGCIQWYRVSETGLSGQKEIA